MDKKTEKKIEPYRLKAEWYEESDPLEIVVVLGGSKLAQATISSEHKFAQVLKLARRVIGQEGERKEREDLSHILSFILIAKAKNTGENIKISLAQITRDVMKEGSGLLNSLGVFSDSRRRHQAGEAFPSLYSPVNKNPAWKKPLLRRLLPYLKQPADDGLPWIDVDAWMRAVERLGQHSKNRDLEAMNSLLAESITSSGFYRPVQPLPGPEAIEGLAEEFPNFSEVAEFYAQQAAIAKISGKGRVRLPPVLLLGPPGVGKTVFSMRLAEIMGVARFSVSFSGLSHAGVISGSSGYWGNGRQGQVFDALQLGKHMNPVFLLDEIDKSVVGGTYRSPLAPLHQLLEMENAKVFQDEFVEVPVDTSWFTWVATANDIDEIPLTILSRLTVFEVEPPTLEQLWVIGERQYRRTIAEYGLAGKLPDAPPAGVLEKAVSSPREMSLALRRLIGRMAREFAAGREIEIEKLTKPEKGSKSGKPRIGFV